MLVMGTVGVLIACSMVSGLRFLMVGLDHHFRFFRLSQPSRVLLVPFPWDPILFPTFPPRNGKKDFSVSQIFRRTGNLELIVH